MSYKKNSEQQLKELKSKISEQKSFTKETKFFFLTKKQTKILELKKSMTVIENTLEKSGKEAER